ncbi:MAG TPA: phytanoyl-CoA dioxygenase family protein [Coleofasciculaceae cyanobacterium]
MSIINTFVDSWRGVQSRLAESAQILRLQPLRLMGRTTSKSRLEDLIKDSSWPNHPEINHNDKIQNYILEIANLNKIIAFLEGDGFALGLNLPQKLTEEIWEFAMHTPCYGNNETKLGFFYSEKEQAQAKHGNPFISGHYYNTALLCPVIKALETDPLLLEIATRYLETEPLHQGNQLWWSFPVESTVYERRRAAQMFYCTLENCRCLNFSFYITDVDLCSNPHVCVRGSHMKKKHSHRFLEGGCSYQEITKYYGYENIVPICGKAGSGFVEDTLCFHKKTVPSSKERLTLQIQFADRKFGIQSDRIDASQLESIL